MPRNTCLRTLYIHVRNKNLHFKRVSSLGSKKHIELLPVAICNQAYVWSLRLLTTSEMSFSQMLHKSGMKLAISFFKFALGLNVHTCSVGII